MKFLFVLTFLLQIIPTLYSQNQIPNSSFEIGECPSGHSVKPNDFKVDFWLSADGGTPDYFHTCGSNNAGERLLNWAGGQFALDGSGYVGIYLKKGLYQENIGIKLKSQLKKGVQYDGTFYIGRASNSEYFPSEISITLEQNPLTIDILNEFDHRLIRFSLKVPKEQDTFSWEKIEFQYEAKGDEQYLYIGSLHKETELNNKNPARIEVEPMLNKAIYVYLDHFSLIETGSGVPYFELVDEMKPIQMFYKSDESLLSDVQLKRLDSLAHMLKLHDYQLLITGSTDSVGTDIYNAELGLKRASNVKMQLVQLGISEGRMEVKTKGESTPNYPNHSEEYRSLNRNTLIEFYIEKNN